MAYAKRCHFFLLQHDTGHVHHRMLQKRVPFFDAGCSKANLLRIFLNFFGPIRAHMGPYGPGPGLDERENF